MAAPEGFILSPSARQDLLEIWEYIAQDSIDAADRIRDEFYDAIRRLAEMPNIGYLREDLVDEPLRVWSMRHYLIIYRADPRPIEIVRVISGYRDVAALLR